MSAAAAALTNPHRVEVPGNATDCFSEHVRRRQRHEAQVLMGSEVESATIRDEHVRRPQQVDHEGLVVVDLLLLGAELREQVHCAARKLAAHPRNLRQQTMGDVALLTKPAARGTELGDL
jgi:hypothetical protein